jgi:Flp pilus assembly protein CpaB
MRTLRLRLGAARQAIRRAVLLRRRLLAAVLTGVAALAGLQATAAPPLPSDWVVAAARDLDAGTVLSADDLTRVAFADGTAPSGVIAADEALGRTLAAPLRRGEPVTDVRLVGAGLLQGYDDLVAVPVRIPDADAVALLKVGDRINLLATDPRGGGTDTVAVDVPILALPIASDSTSAAVTTAGLSGRLVVIGTSAEMSETVAAAAVSRFLSLTVSR